MAQNEIVKKQSDEWHNLANFLRHGGVWSPDKALDHIQKKEWALFELRRNEYFKGFAVIQPMEEGKEHMVTEVTFEHKGRANGYAITAFADHQAPVNGLTEGIFHTDVDLISHVLLKGESLYVARERREQRTERYFQVNPNGVIDVGYIRY